MAERSRWQNFALCTGPLVFAVLLLVEFVPAEPGSFGERPVFAGALAFWMALWWISEAVPIHWTACLPLIVIPFTPIYGGEMGANFLSALLPYVDPYIFLFLGGMGIAAAMQQWNLHRRIALAVMRAVGTHPRRLLFGVLLATAFVSLWISNTATAAMMFPIGLAVIAELERETGRRLARYGAAVMLAVAYGSNVGGIGTKIGTVPSAQLSGFLAQRGTEVSFGQFAAVGVPFVLIFLPVVWLALWRLGRVDAPEDHVGRAALERESGRLGPMRRGEAVVLAVFLVSALLWIFGQPLTDVLRGPFPGLASSHYEAGVAMLASAALFVWRSEGGPVLAPSSMRFVQWETLVLLGGGFSLAATISASGLSLLIGEQLSALREATPLAQLVAASFTTVTLSAFASNAATVAVLLPVLAASVSPEHANAVLFAATFAASCDFALPAGTPPNAIVFGSGYLTIPLMARTGVVLDALGALLAALWCGFIVPYVL
jgi:sodium-dependent dicarboxylate transporter 2/3/5